MAGRITAEGLHEASALTRSGRRGDMLWVLNDSRNPPELFAIATNGAPLGTWTVTDAIDQDWEDLALWESPVGPILVVAEVGHNSALRSHATLYLVPGPEIVDTGGPGGMARVRAKLHFRYEDGARDCEAVAVNPKGPEVLMLSKRDQPPVLYAVPLVPIREVVIVTNLVARRLGAIAAGPWAPRPEPAWFAPRSLEIQPTGMDLDPVGRRLVVLTYSDAWFVEIPDHGHWTSVTTGAWQRCSLPARDITGPEALRGREAVAWSRDGQTVFVTGEGRHAPIWVLQVR